MNFTNNPLSSPYLVDNFGHGLISTNKHRNVDQADKLTFLKTSNEGLLEETIKFTQGIPLSKSVEQESQTNLDLECCPIQQLETCLEEISKLV